MEINNNFAERRMFLERRSENFKSAAEGEVNVIKGKISKVGKSALIVGVGVLSTYFLYKMFLGKKEIQAFVQPQNMAIPDNKIVIQQVDNGSPLVNRIKEQIALFLISIAKQKLQEYIEGLGKKSNG